MTEIIPRGHGVLVDSNFGSEAVTAFEKTYSVLFSQALTEADRLERVNNAMSVLEQELLDPERIAQMDTAQRLMLLDMLSRTSNSSIKNLMGFGNLFMNIKTVVGVLESVKTKDVTPKRPDVEDLDASDIEFSNDDLEGLYD
jgi:hypothetical protein